MAAEVRMRGAIFDLDGTLADTSADLIAAANAVLGPRRLPLLDAERDKPVAGRGGKAMIRRALSRMETSPAPEEAGVLVDDLYPALLTAYEGCLAHETRLYEGVEDCLAVLAERGWQLGVCTNKPERLALALLEALGVRDRFGAILGADTLAVRKPDPEHLFETIRRMGARAEHAVLLGDTKTDVDAAAAAGIPCVLTAFGFAAEPLAELRAAAVIHHFDEVPALLERLRPTQEIA